MQNNWVSVGSAEVRWLVSASVFIIKVVFFFIISYRLVALQWMVKHNSMHDVHEIYQIVNTLKPDAEIPGLFRAICIFLFDFCYM